MVATSRAKHKIRHWLNTEQKHRSIELGRKLIEREAKRYRVQWRKLVAENALDGVLSEHGLPRLDDLYADVGYGKIVGALDRRAIRHRRAEGEGPARRSGRACSSRPSARSSRSRPQRRRSRSRATTTC